MSNETPGPKPGPYSLDPTQMLLRGVDVGGERLSKVIGFFSDGRRFSIELPESLGSPVEVEPLVQHECEGLIVDLFKRMEPETRLSTSQVHSLLKEPIGTVKKHLAALAKRGVLHNSGEPGFNNPGYGRGPKFPTD